ncbi:hypothetical protein VOM14_11315 [Paraburkholderia sp. MPAMCS5]|uniref:hypothetical protein n=1 Tax=Paraburkholderia sp. MPAMCS5 TaxID=3112563 RepID=UPI002E19FC9A|nr:hypothetical protein [Paraburkholderia sp. MPAMCS5]
MVKRRQFIGGLTALAGSYLLSACGGGGSEDGSASPAAKVAANPKAKASNASDSGTTIPPAGSITDNNGAVWTLKNGSVYKNGSKAGNTYDVSLLLWYNGGIYHEGTGGQFYGWNGSNWSACLDPRMGGVSADGTTLPSSPYIIDKSNSMWTLVNGVIYRDGETVGNTYNVTLVLWYGGKVWHCGTGGQFYVNADVDGQWRPSSDPRIAVAPAPGSFYGMNGHFDYTYTPTQLVSILKAMNCTSYRVGVTDDPDQLNAVVKIAKAFQSAGLTLLVLIDQGVYDAPGRVMASESIAYSRGFSTGSTVANALKPYGVTIYECGNELTRQDATVVDFTYAGTKASDFNNDNWPIMRGVMRGMIDGVKSAQSSAQCGINFCVADVGAADALWDGMQPDGSGGYPTVRWDITTWHNYEVYGDLFDVGTDGAGPGFDLATYCKARYGVPFIVTEWNTGPEQTESYRANYISDRLAAFYAARKTHNIQSVMYYVLDSGNNAYGIMINGSPISAPYNAFTNFTSAHADN